MVLNTEVKVMSSKKTASRKDIDLLNKFEELISRIPEKSGLQSEFYSLMSEFKTLSGEFDETKLKLLREIAERKATELFMRNSAQKFETIFNAVYDGLIINNLDEEKQELGSTVEANDAALKLFEYSLAELRTLSILAVFTAGFDPASVREELMSGKEAVYEAEIVSKSGMVILCELRSKLFTLGGKRYFVTVLRDIREPRAFKQKLQEQESELRSAQAAAKLSSWSHELTVGKHRKSELILKILGFERKKGEKLPVNTLLNALHPEDRDKVRNIYHHISGKSEFSLDFRIMLPHGGIRYIYSTGKLLADKSGNPVRVVGVNQDITEKRLAEENLRQSERNLRSILEAIGVGQWEYDPEGKRFKVSESLAEFYGYSRTQTVFEERAVFERINIEDRARVKNELHDLFAGKSSCLNSTFRVKHKNGEFIWVLYRAVLIKNINGEAMRAVGCVEDLTESMRVNKMKEQLEFFERMINTIPIPIFYKDMDGKYMGYNEAAGEFWERHINCPVIGQTVYDVFQSRNDMKVAQTIDQREKKLIATGGSFVKSFKFINSSGEERFLIEHKSILTGYDKKPQCVINAVFDMTDIKKAEVSLRKTTQRLNLTLNAMQEIIMCFDSNFNLQWGNRPARNTFAPGGKKFVGRQWQELWFGDREITADEFHILKAFDGDGGMAKNLVKAANGKSYEVWTYPVKDRRGKITLVVEAALDVTEKLIAESRAKVHQQQLIQVDKMKSLGILVAGVAHEINNPNNFISINVSILGKIWNDFLPVLKQQMATNQKQTFGGIPAAKIEHSVKTLLKGINDGSERIKTIVDNLKGYVRETPPDRVELFSVNEALANSTLLMNNLLKKSTRKFTVSPGNNIPPVSGVQQRIEQVIINILQNACHALSNPEQGIRVSTYCNRGREVVIEVKDEGCGIDEKNLKYITDPFFTTKRDSGGTGLGLSISFSIMEEHKGRLEFESRKGAGTTARIILPVAT